MKFRLAHLPRWTQVLMAPAAGAMIPFALAPYNLWPLGIASLLVLAAMLQSGQLPHPGRSYFFKSFLYGLGLYGVGASWVYVSISEFGSTSQWLSLLLTVAFVAGLSLVFALPFWLYGRFVPRTSTGLLLGFPALWVLGEWTRSWFLTGFPWLYIGYGHIHTWLGGWAPVFGVFGVSFAVALSASALLVLYRYRRHRMFSATVKVALGLLPVLWLSGLLLQHIQWTQVSEKPIVIGMAQGNIPQERKWDRDFLEETFDIFEGLSRPLWQYDWVIWPEAAIPLMYHEALPALTRLDAQAKATDTVFITGILYDEREPVRYYYNSIVARGEGSGIAFKTRLVPFGEYVPLEKYLRGLIEFFDLPTSIIHSGPTYKGGLRAKDVTIAPSICYEVVYPDLVASRAAQAEVLLTVSNDAWFGNSIGPVQHFEMAQMRALETGRYMVRATNNGLSGIVDTRGNIVTIGGRFTREAITGSIYAAHGETPFIIWGSWPVVILAFALVGGVVLLPVYKERKQAQKVADPAELAANNASNSE